MLELRLNQAILLKNVLEALSDLFPEAYFDISRKGLKLQAMDTSHVALVSFFLRADAFNDYHCDGDRSMGLNLADMAKAFRCANNDDIITIKAEDDDHFDIVTFTFKSPKDGDTSCYDFNFVDINGLPLETPESTEFECQAIVRMPSAKFMGICKKLSSFADRGDRDTVVLISVDEECVDFFTTGKAGTSTITCRQTQTVGKPEESTLVEMKEKVSLAFDLRCMNSFSKVSTLSDQVTISLSSSKEPAVFEYKIKAEYKNKDIGYIRYYIMPRRKEETETLSAYRI